MCFLHRKGLTQMFLTKQKIISINPFLS